MIADCTARTEENDHDVAPLPRPVQEHLGRQLRSTLNEAAPKPAFLGDTDLPPQFERLIRRMETSERVHEVGVEAVRRELGRLDGE